MESNPTVAREFVLVREEIRLEVWRLAKEALPVTCYADLFGKPQQVRWTVDRVLERLAMGAGATHTLKALVADEASRCPRGWSGGKPTFHTPGNVRYGTYSPPTRPYGYWDYQPLGLFVQSDDGNWHYRRRTEDMEQDIPESWMIEYLPYTPPPTEA